MERYLWEQLPETVRLAVQDRLGRVVDVCEVDMGQNSNLALIVRTERERVFVKGVRGVSPPMRWLRNEVETGSLAPGIAPSCRFSADIEADEAWFVVGFEYVEGRPADLSPGSGDLAIVGTTLGKIGALSGVGVQPLSIRWARADWWLKLAAEAPEQIAGWDVEDLTDWCRTAAVAVRGDALLHTDLHEQQFVIDDATASVRVLDWGRPASGAAWVDAAFLVLRLIAAGHEPAQGEEWARSVPAWAQRTDEGVTAFAAYVAGLWAYRAVTSPFPGAAKLSEVASRYARYRLDG